MSAITLINQTTDTTVEFHLSHGAGEVIRIGIHPGGRANVPTTPRVIDEHNDDEIPTAQEWQAYAILNGITTPKVQTSDPNATITVLAGNNDDGFTLTVS